MNLTLLQDFQVLGNKLVEFYRDMSKNNQRLESLYGKNINRSIGEQSLSCKVLEIHSGIEEIPKQQRRPSR